MAAPSSIVTSGAQQVKCGTISVVQPGSFSAEASYYPRALNSQMHPTVFSFFGLDNRRVAKRFCMTHPRVSEADVLAVLDYELKHFRWAGCDVFNAVDMAGSRKSVIVETNSCASGQKSTPWLRDDEEQNGYKRLVHSAFAAMLDSAAAAQAASGGPTVPSSEEAARGSAQQPPAVALKPVGTRVSFGHAGSGGRSAAGSGSTGSATSFGSSAHTSPLLPPPQQQRRGDSPPALSVHGADSPPTAGAGAEPGGTGAGAVGPTGGVLAVIFDKNSTEAGAYAAALADAYGEPVYLAELFLTDPAPPVRWDASGVMHVRARQAAEGGGGEAAEEWLAVRAALRYVTQRPWTRIPLTSRTPLLNGVLPCLAGGRNKLMAARAYEEMNVELACRGSALRLCVPETVIDVVKADVPALIAGFGGRGVVKVPYSNAGQGVYTILTPAELAAFMALPHHYDKFIVQRLVGHAAWEAAASVSSPATLFHIGTVPDAAGSVFATDLRIMVCSARGGGLQPVAMYARKAQAPLSAALPDGRGGATSWQMLGTNLSKLVGDLTWSTESERLVLMDRRDFCTLGLGLDDIIDAYIQTALAVVAIDRMCARLLRPDGSFDLPLFRSLNPDDVLVREILQGSPDLLG